MKRHLVGVTLSALFAAAVAAQTTAFNFQGRLNDGTTPANGNYSLIFKLYDAIQGGTLVGTADRPNTTVVNGVFSTTLTFPGAFTGGDRFLEIGVRPAGSQNAYVVLGARQQLLAVPFAILAADANNAGYAQVAQVAVTAGNATNATTAQNSLSLGGVAANQYARLSFANQGDLVGANIGSNGYLSVQSNAFQPAASNGFPKLMMAVTASGAIARCYNGVTGVAGGNCGGITIVTGGAGSTTSYTITFPFQVSDRYWLVTSHQLSEQRLGDVITTSVGPPTTPNPNVLIVVTQLNGSNEHLPFHLFIF